MFEKILRKTAAVFLVLAVIVNFVPAAFGQSNVRREAQQFIDNYTSTWSKLRYESALAEWQSNTMIIDGDDTNAKATIAANAKLVAFTGNKQNIASATWFLKLDSFLTELQVKQLKAILYVAAGSPETAKDLVDKRLKAEAEQTEKLFGFDFKIDGKSVTTNDIDKILRSSNDLTERRKAKETKFSKPSCFPVWRKHL